MVRLVICKYIDWIGSVPINLTPCLPGTFVLFQTCSLGKKLSVLFSCNSHSPNYVAVCNEFPFPRFARERSARIRGKILITRLPPRQIISRELFHFYEHDRKRRATFNKPWFGFVFFASFSFVRRLTTLPRKRSRGGENECMQARV